MAAIVVASEGGTQLQLQHLLGHTSEAESAIYTRQAVAAEFAREAGKKLLRGLK
jgi:hypothetical protein